MISGFLAQGLEPEAAALTGAFIHGLCGDMLAEDSPVGFLASDMVEQIPHALGTLLS
ncbi:MAG: hypothetical protein MI892_28140 [Desulfobacterales bacterium]|nr:hypothetical protein [Desulfobacterales bacterium]